MLKTTGQAAAYLNISKATINRWQKKGILHPLYTPGGHRRFLESDLRAAVGLDAITAPDTTERVVVYAVSPHASRRTRAISNVRRSASSPTLSNRDTRWLPCSSKSVLSVNEHRPQLRKALQKKRLRPGGRHPGGLLQHKSRDLMKKLESSFFNLSRVT
jgi:excisionase family DNA binding protein